MIKSLSLDKNELTDYWNNFKKNFRSKSRNREIWFKTLPENARERQINLMKQFNELNKDYAEITKENFIANYKRPFLSWCLAFLICFGIFKLFRSEESKFEKKWKINAFAFSREWPAVTGSVEFQKDGTTIIVMNANGKATSIFWDWKIYQNNIMDLGKNRYKYDLSGNRLKLISQGNTKNKIYIELESD